MLLLMCTASAAAQRGTDSVTFDATIGGGHGAARRHYTEQGQLAGTVTLGLRSSPGAARGRIYAVTAGGQAPFLDNGDTCELESLTSTHCVPRFPGTGRVAVLVGQEWRSGDTELRAMLGPAAFFGTRTGLGPHAVLDAAAGSTHVEFVAAFRASYDMRFDGERLRLTSFEFGLRLQ